MQIFNLPDLGEGLPDAEIIKWHVKEGDSVKVDDLLVSMETAKAVVEVPSPIAGTITKLHGQAGDIILTDAPLVTFSVVARSDSDAATQSLTETTPSAALPPLHRGELKEQGATVAGKIEIGDRVLHENAMGVLPTHAATKQIKALPAVRALAKLLKIDLNTVKGTGQAGEITLEDIQSGIQTNPFSRSAGEGNLTLTPNPSPASGRGEQYDLPRNNSDNKIEPLRGARRAMAEAMTSSQEVVPVSAFDDADISQWAANTDLTCRILRAMTLACQGEPSLNAHFYKKNNERILWKQVNIGIAMDSPHGLFAPVIKKIDELSQEAIRAKINEFKKTVQDRSIAPSDLQGSTIQLSNFGVFAGHYATSIIVPPNVAIVGVGKIGKRAIEEEAKIVMHPFIPICITIDHRAVTGGEATRFLKIMIEDLQKTH